MVPLLGDSLEKGTEASKAIMTTDTKNKQVAVQIDMNGTTVTIGGMCKGSGHDPSKYVYYVKLCYYGRSQSAKTASGSIKRRH